MLKMLKMLKTKVKNNVKKMESKIS